MLCNGAQISDQEPPSHFISVIFLHESRNSQRSFLQTPTQWILVVLVHECPGFARSFMQVDVVEFGLYGKVSARIAAKPSAMEPGRRGARESRLAPLFPAKVEAVEP